MSETGHVKARSETSVVLWNIIGWFLEKERFEMWSDALLVPSKKHETATPKARRYN
jgi:hypothetical protein